MIITVMSISQGLRNVLDILAELAHNDTETDESNIISQSVLQELIEQQQPCLPLRLYRDGELSHANSGSLI